MRLAGAHGPDLMLQLTSHRGPDWQSSQAGLCRPLLYIFSSDTPLQCWSSGHYATARPGQWSDVTKRKFGNYSSRTILTGTMFFLPANQGTEGMEDWTLEWCKWTHRSKHTQLIIIADLVCHVQCIIISKQPHIRFLLTIGPECNNTKWIARGEGEYRVTTNPPQLTVSIRGTEYLDKFKNRVFKWI